MFIEHIVSKYDGMEKYAKRLEMVCLCHRTISNPDVVNFIIAGFFLQYLKSDPDFLKCSTIDKVKKHLNLMDGELRKKLK